MVTRLRWGRILLGGLLIELTMFAVYIPLQSVNPQAAYSLVPVLGLATAFLFGWWVARGTSGRRQLHGALTAVAASVMWISMVVASGGLAATPVLFHVVNVLRVFAGLAGGVWAERQASQAAAAAT